MTIELDRDVSRETNSEFGDSFNDEMGEPLFDVSRETESDYSPPVGGVKTGDTDAPYGFTSNGQVRAKPGRKPGQKTGTGKTAGPTMKAPPKKAAPKTPPTRKSTQVDYRPALLNLTGQGIGALAITGLMRNNETLLADAAALANAQVGLCEFVNSMADQYAVVAAILDKVLKVGPHVEGGLSLLILGGQLLVNHKVVPAGLVPGTQPPGALISAFLEKQMAESDAFRATVEMLQTRPPAAAA